MNSLSDRRRELGLSVDELYRKTGVPRFRIMELEAGRQSLRVIPFSQCCALALALEVPLYLWYHWVSSNDYSEWLKGRLKHG